MTKSCSVLGVVEDKVLPYLFILINVFFHSYLYVYMLFIEIKVLILVFA